MTLDDIRHLISTAVGLPVLDLELMGGGCVSEVFLVRLARGERVVAKIDRERGDRLPVEGEMLRYLSLSTGLPVPGVIAVSPHCLVLEFITGQTIFSRAAEAHAAELLATLHDKSSALYGFQFATLIGGLTQPNLPYQSWPAFFIEQRLLYMAGEALREGRLPPAIFDRLENFSRHLTNWLPEPARPALIHGDVWTTNVLASGGRIVGFLDPAIYFADPEIELAFITLFNTFGADFFNRYNELHPIRDGFFEERRHIYNLYPLLVHVRLFGGSYVAGVERILTRFGF